jgi:FSR family fosmidomycin resistance protein-like MFS transporter
LKDRESRPRRFFIHACAHFVNDTYSGFLAPLLPLLALKHNLTLAQAGLLVTCQTLSASLAQPVWGWFSDRFPGRWYIPVGLFSAGFFLSLIGTAPEIFTLILVIFLGGLGVSCFHPLGTATASAMAGRRKGLAIALYITAGSTGYALGPVFISTLVAYAGLQRTYLAVIPAVVAVILWMSSGPKIASVSARQTQTVLEHRPDVKVRFSSAVAVLRTPIFLLTANSAVRAFTLLTYLNFMSFHLEKVGLGLKTRALYLFVLQIGDALGNLLGGGFSDRLGRWRVMFWTPLATMPFLLLFLNLKGGIALAPLFIAGILLFASAPAVIVSAQKIMVGREGMASALQIGFAWGTAGLLMGFVGKLGEWVGVYKVLYGVSFFPFLMSFFVLRLKKYRNEFEV